MRTVGRDQLIRDADGKLPETRTLPCLRCRKDFESVGPGNRMCHDCRNFSASPYAL